MCRGFGRGPQLRGGRFGREEFLGNSIFEYHHHHHHHHHIYIYNYISIYIYRYIYIYYNYIFFSKKRLSLFCLFLSVFVHCWFSGFWAGGLPPPRTSPLPSHPAFSAFGLASSLSCPLVSAFGLANSN